MSHYNKKSLTHNKCNRNNKINSLNNYDYIVLNQQVDISLIDAENISVRANNVTIGTAIITVGLAIVTVSKDQIVKSY